ncbi:hypothetical protein V1264_023327 [Littorina saxatilis]|uniref:TIR domain-containing protein n=1 Tax=Littorina saxatilis TaxID=31220 RepID=A0AAN9B9C1_9CAEN
MASSTSYVASSSSIENIPTTTNNNEHDDMVANKNDVINLRHKVCNGVVRNTSYPTLSLEATTTSAKTPTLSQSLSAQNVKKSVSTVFSSGNRKSWQLSLSNYSQENVARKDSSSSPRKGDLQLKTFSEQSVPLIRTSSGSKDNYACSPVRRSQSNVIVYSDESASKPLLQDESNLAQGQNVGQGENRAVGQGQNRDLGQGVNRDSGQSQNCEIGQGYAANFDCGDRTEGDCANDTDNQNYGNKGAEGTPSPEGYQQQQSCYVLNEQQQTGSSCRVQSPSCHPGAALTWSNYQEPHQLRHQGPNTSNHSSHNQQHSTSPGADNSMELSMYSSTFPNTQICAAGEDSSGHRANSTTQRNAGPSGSANSPNCDQSVSVLQTSGQSESLSFSSQGKRKDSDKTVRYSAEIEWKDGHSRKRNQSRDYGCEKRVRESGTLSSDCVLDTQPLLPVLRVRVDGGSNSGSPDMSMDNQLVRFHSLDSKESYRSEQCERSPQLMQRAISVNTTTNLALDPSHLLVQGGFGSASSPTGSDCLAAPPLNELYRYHVFLSHCAEDVGWVEEVVARLQAPPYCYKCAYSPVVDEQDPGAPEQNLLCSAMLSERVVLVLSEQYVETTWFVFEKVLRQLTQMSLHNQRIMGVLLEDCHIPDTLGELYFLDTSDPDFFDVFTKRLKTGRIPRSSESVSSDLAGRNSIALPSVVNGQTLAQCTLAVKVGWDSYLEIADSSEDLPPSLKSHGINVSGAYNNNNNK